MPVPSTPARSAPVLLVLVALVVALVGGLGVAAAGGLLGERSPRVRPASERALVADRPEVRALALLRAWDRRRADAWAADDAAALGALYLPGSSAGRHDLAMLAAWRARGLRVEGLRTQVVGVRVLAHRPGRFELSVVDRVSGGTVVGPSADSTPGPLPRDGPTGTRVVLMQRGEEWVVASVSAARSGAPP